MIGSLEAGDGISESRIKIGPFYRWNEGIFGDEDYGMNLQVDESGPFESCKAYLRHHARYYNDPTKKSPLATGSRALLDMKGDARFVNKSHIFEAIAIAAYDDVRRLEVVRKTVGRVSRVDDDEALEIIEDAVVAG